MLGAGFCSRGSGVRAVFNRKRQRCSTSSKSRLDAPRRQLKPSLEGDCENGRKWQAVLEFEEVVILVDLTLWQEYVRGLKLYS